jgi:hypothetical protein
MPLDLPRHPEAWVPWNVLSTYPGLVVMELED